MSSPTRSWWKAGVRFECQGSGKCCLSRGTHGYVYLTLKDRQRLAAYFGMTTREFTRRYCGEQLGWHFLRPADERLQNPEQEQACRFLVNRRCSVYEARPAQCRTWPFWPENMQPKNWDREVTQFCPGVGKGRVWPAEEIADLLAQDPLNAD